MKAMVASRSARIDFFGSRIDFVDRPSAAASRPAVGGPALPRPCLRDRPPSARVHVRLHRLLHVPDLPAEPAEEALRLVGHRRHSSPCARQLDAIILRRSADLRHRAVFGSYTSMNFCTSPTVRSLWPNVRMRRSAFAIVPAEHVLLIRGDHHAGPAHALRTVDEHRLVLRVATIAEASDVARPSASRRAGSGSARCRTPCRCTTPSRPRTRACARCSSLSSTRLTTVLILPRGSRRELAQAAVAVAIEHAVVHDREVVRLEALPTSTARRSQHDDAASRLRISHCGMRPRVSVRRAVVPRRSSGPCNRADRPAACDRAASSCLERQVLVQHFVHQRDRRRPARAEAFQLDQREPPVRRRLADLDARASPARARSAASTRRSRTTATGTPGSGTCPWACSQYSS